MTSLGTVAAQLAALRFLAPAWRPAGFILLGVTGGMALFVFHISRATSYLSDSPETCMNCHVMTTQYVTWQHSSHARVATCWTCKSPDVPRLMASLGPAKFYAGKFDDFRKEITHPIGCLDCHEPNTMKLRITRPALREAFARQGKDIDRVSHQEMRTLVCAQCHVEYYFKKKGNYLTFAWDKGTSPEQMEQYFDEAQFADWTHAISKARMIKMRLTAWASTRRRSASGSWRRRST